MTYKITKDGKGKVGTQNTLYTACRSIVDMKDGNVLNYRNELIAFYDSWNKVVKPGFQANSIEAEAIRDYNLTGAR